jgi:hypothetical protein
VIFQLGDDASSAAATSNPATARFAVSRMLHSVMATFDQLRNLGAFSPCFVSSQRFTSILPDALIEVKS